jgi:hypothetical protein
MSAAATAPRTIMVRARLTDAEWLELRQIGLRTRTPVADLVASALRGCYPLTPDAAPSVRPAHQEGNPPA